MDLIGWIRDHIKAFHHENAKMDTEYERIAQRLDDILAGRDPDPADTGDAGPAPTGLSGSTSGSPSDGDGPSES